MLKKTIISFAITIISLSVAACSDGQASDKVDRTLNIEDVEHKLEVWDTLVGLDDTEDYLENEEEIETVLGSGIGQLVIENPIAEERFSIKNGTDIWYNNILYKGLYTNVNQIKTPYNTNEFINAIIRLYVTNESPVYTELVVDLTSDVSGNSIEEADASELASVVLLDEQLQSNRQYMAIRNKYNKPSTWRLNLFNEDRKNLGSIVGCETYIVLLGVEDTVHFDMENALSKDIKQHVEKESNTVELSGVNIVDSAEQVSGNDITNSDWELNFRDVDTAKTKFKDLAVVIQNIESPYTTDDLISYIVGVYKTDASTVYCERKTSGIGDGELSIGEELLENFGEQYRVYRDTYGKDVTWKINIFEYGGNNEMVIYGCDSYVIELSENEATEVTVDTSETVDEITETTVETDDEIKEETSLSENETEENLEETETEMEDEQ